jgi:hypothetical protein
VARRHGGEQHHAEETKVFFIAHLFMVQTKRLETLLNHQL